MGLMYLPDCWGYERELKKNSDCGAQWNFLSPYIMFDGLFNLIFPAQWTELMNTEYNDSNT